MKRERDVIRSRVSRVTVHCDCTFQLSLFTLTSLAGFFVTMRVFYSFLKEFCAMKDGLLLDLIFHVVELAERLSLVS